MEGPQLIVNGVGVSHVGVGGIESGVGESFTNEFIVRTVALFTTLLTVVNLGAQDGVQLVEFFGFAGGHGGEYSGGTPVGFHFLHVVGVEVAAVVEDGQAHGHPVDGDVADLFDFFDPAGGDPAEWAGHVEPESYFFAHYYSLYCYLGTYVTVFHCSHRGSRRPR